MKKDTKNKEVKISDTSSTKVTTKASTSKATTGGTSITTEVASDAKSGARKESNSSSQKVTMQVRQVASTIGQTKRQAASVRGLGLRRVGHIREVEDTAATRGLVNSVKHLVEIIGV